MDEDSKKELDRVTQLTPEELTPEDIDFMYGRRSYLGSGARRDFAEVLAKKDKEATDTKVPASDAPLYVAKKDRVKTEEA